jgi:predicted amidohydrolase
LSARAPAPAGRLEICYDLRFPEATVLRWSQIVDPYGQRLAQADEREETLLVADVEPEKARDEDYVIPGEYELYLFDHRRPELYGTLVEEPQSITT